MKARHLIMASGFAGSLLLLGGEAHAQAALRAACSQDGQIVLREDLPLSAGEMDKIRVRARFPQALCVFVPVDDTKSSKAFVDLPAAKPTTGPPILATGDGDLATALALISSGQASPDGGGDGVPVDLTSAMQAFRSGKEPVSEPVSNTINLTIGIYKDMAAADILAHWKLMQQDTMLLQRLTPTLTKAKDITMLSVENVPDGSADAVCKEAGKIGSGCLAFY